MTIQELFNHSQPSNFHKRLQNEYPDLPIGSADLKQKNQSGNLRQLTPTEIDRLTKQHNYCAQWEIIKVVPNFQSAFIIGNQFLGSCVLGSFTGKNLEIESGTYLPTGIYYSTLQNADLGDDCLIHRCPRLSKVMVAAEAAVLNSNISCAARTWFGNGSWIDVGIETGGRQAPIFADLSLTAAEFIASNPGNAAIRLFLDQEINRLNNSHTRPYSIIDTHARVIDCPRIVSSFIGQGAKIINASAIENSCVDSTLADPIMIGAGSIVCDSILQEGVCVEYGAMIQSSMLFEHSHASHHGKVANCLIGPNTGISKGEVTASFLGPFVGFHHQSMLIATFWPQGRGNVAYGANIGSNHTSRLPDQEIWPGEGMFFGLGCTVKFPANFRESPYTIIAAGIITLPQRLSFPFSLINEPVSYNAAIIPGLQNLIPAWGLSDNYYALKRNEGKFKERNKAKHSDFDFSVFRPEILSLMQAALNSLESVSTIKELYLPGDIPGIGKNVLTEPNRQKAIKAYRFFLGLERCRAVFQAAASGESKANKTHIISDLKNLATMLPVLVEKSIQSRQRDFKRGCEIIDDYGKTHLPINQDHFILQLQSEIAAELASVNTLLASVKG